MPVVLGVSSSNPDRSMRCSRQTPRTTHTTSTARHVAAAVVRTASGQTAPVTNDRLETSTSRGRRGWVAADGRGNRQPSGGLTSNGGSAVAATPPLRQRSGLRRSSRRTTPRSRGKSLAVGIIGVATLSAAEKPSERDWANLNLAPTVTRATRAKLVVAKRGNGGLLSDQVDPNG